MTEFMHIIKSIVEKAGGTQEALELIYSSPRPYKLRKACKLIKKTLRAMIRIEHGETVSPISEKYYI